MFILKPTQPEIFGKEEIGTIEEVVQDSRLVDKGIRELKKLSLNAPSFDPERRTFLKHVAALAGLYATGQLLKGYAIAQEPVQLQGKTYGGWEAWLMSQDLIRGPEPLYRPTGDLPYDNHLNREGRHAIDYDVPIGTPNTPTADSYSSFIPVYDRTGGNVLHLLHSSPYRRTVYAHLSKIADTIYEGKPSSRGGRPVIDNELSKLKIIAYSGNTGIGPGGGTQRPHLHFEISSTTNNQMYSLDPFTLGIDAEKPVDEYPKGRSVSRPAYWDAETEMPPRPNRVGEKKVLLRKSLETLDKRVRESDLDNATKEEILKRRNNPTGLRDYLGYRVLEKKKGKDGGGKIRVYAGLFDVCFNA